MRRFPVVIAVLAAVTLLALACGERRGGGPAAPAGGAAPAGQVKPGAAGIPSNPRNIAGIFTIDDGLAMWDKRPAGEDRTGITKDTIKLGKHSPLTGPLAPVNIGPAVKVLIDEVNKAGGVHGRKIELIERDTAWNPSQGVQVAQQLVERDRVFALFGGQGSAIEFAIKDYLVKNKVPDLFQASSAAWIAEPTEKTRFSGIATGEQTGLAIADYLAAKDPRAKIAVIFQNDEYGKAILPPLRRGVQRSGGQVVAEISFEIVQPDLTPQVQQAVNARPDYIVIEAQGPQAAQMMKALRETLGSRIPVLMGAGFPGLTPGTPHLDGIVSAIYIYAPTFLDKPSVQAAKALMEKNGVPFNNLALIGVMWVEHMVRALELAGPDPTREGLIEALETGFDGTWTCSICFGPTIFGPQDHWSMETLQVVQWSEARGGPVPIGEPMSYETSHGKGIRGNLPGFDCTPETCPWKR